jgi:hypothetical protein
MCGSRARRFYDAVRFIQHVGEAARLFIRSGYESVPTDYPNTHALTHSEDSQIRSIFSRLIGAQIYRWYRQCD